MYHIRHIHNNSLKSIYILRFSNVQKIDDYTGLTIYPDQTIELEEMVIYIQTKFKFNNTDLIYDTRPKNDITFQSDICLPSIGPLSHP